MSKTQRHEIEAFLGGDEHYTPEQTDQIIDEYLAWERTRPTLLATVTETTDSDGYITGGTIGVDTCRGGEVIGSPWSRTMSEQEAQGRDWDEVLAAQGYTVVGDWNDHAGYWTATVTTDGDDEDGIAVLTAIAKRIAGDLDIDALAAADRDASRLAAAARDELKAAVIALVRSGGMSESEAMRRAGVTRMTVRAWLGK